MAGQVQFLGHCIKSDGFRFDECGHPDENLNKSERYFIVKTFHNNTRENFSSAKFKIACLKNQKFFKLLHVYSIQVLNQTF